MIAIRTVLSPVDFSPATARQVDIATALCEKFKARLVLHHNLSAVAVGAGVGWMYAADHPPMSEETVQRHLDQLAESRTGIETETTITQGPSSVAVLAVQHIESTGQAKDHPHRGIGHFLSAVVRHVCNRNALLTRE